MKFTFIFKIHKQHSLLSVNCTRQQTSVWEVRQKAGTSLYKISVRIYKKSMTGELIYNFYKN